MREMYIIDSIMGSGKTSWAIQYMNEAPALEKILFVSPFLDEVSRIKNSVTNRTFVEPNNANDAGRKMDSLKDLIVKGHDIATTHSLFRMADDELIELLTDSGYTLILDEVMSVVEPVPVNARDIKRLEQSGDIRIEGTRVIWTGDPNDDSRYKDIRMLAQAQNLFYHRGKFLIWTFPARIFKTFNKVYLLTYLFDGQEQRYYYDMFGLKYEYRAVEKRGDRYELCEYDPRRENREKLRALIDVYEGKLNDIGKRTNALSATYLRRADINTLKKIRDNLYNFFTHIAKAKKHEVYYSTLQDVEKTIMPKGYKEPRKKRDDNDEEGSSRKPKKEIAIPHNIRATNYYADRWAIAYIFNRYSNPHVRAFFEDNNVRVNEDLMAAADLLQWIWRSRIRNGKPIKLYLPSSRMRSLLEAWAKYEI